MNSTFVLGCRVDDVDLGEAVRRIVGFAESSKPSLVVTLGTEMIVRAQRDERFRSVVNACALSLCDTIGVLVASRLRGVHLSERVTGIDLIDPLCRAFAARGVSVFLVGSKGDTARRAGDVLRSRFPDLRIAGARDGFFPADQDAAVAAEVARSGARVCFAGLGSPRQEVWLADRLGEMGCSVGIGLGGSLDVLAGNVRRAPALARRLHVEWLYRLAREPKRWRRQLALPYFVFLVTCQTLRERGRQASVRGI